eukprot:CAMPEP_0204482338 /NCGR_PEP_ID=MMETSP0471-20130131/50676_1 /ASSEMBLY_ACC=CAM_ASM_000602 /TAXON_ID=2969 /ORGANISM="Oxyrrhis marina" /LENGTH=66 /DNA_ID=CAMNT_0051485587 /DNA_START=92 /DNA_END=289 /DNA_ORIENTATION=+
MAFCRYDEACCLANEAVSRADAAFSVADETLSRAFSPFARANRAFSSEDPAVLPTGFPGAGEGLSC